MAVSFFIISANSLFFFAMRRDYNSIPFFRECLSFPCSVNNYIFSSFFLSHLISTQPGCGGSGAATHTQIFWRLFLRRHNLALCCTAKKHKNIRGKFYYWRSFFSNQANQKFLVMYMEMHGANTFPSSQYSYEFFGKKINFIPRTCLWCHNQEQNAPIFLLFSAFKFFNKWMNECANENSNDCF